MPTNSGGAGGMDQGPMGGAGGETDVTDPGGAPNLSDAGPTEEPTETETTEPTDGGSETELPEIDLDAGSDAGADSGSPSDSLDASVDAGSSVPDSGTTETETETDTEPEVDAGDPEPAEGAAEVSCSWGSASASTYYFSVSMVLTNTGDEPMDLRDIELLYYYSADGREATQTAVINDSPVGAMGDTVVSLEETGGDPPEGADHYILVSFAECSTGCTLAAGASLSRAVQIGMNSQGVVGPPGGPFNVTNDYSFTPNDDDPCEFVVVLQNSTRIFGTPPEN